MILLSEWSKTKFNWMAAVVVYGLKIIGLAPLSHQIMNFRLSSGETCTVRGFCFSRIGTAYSILLLTIHQVITSLIMLKFGNSLVTNAVTIIVTNGFCCLASSVIIISSIFRQNEAVSVMNRLLEVDLLLSGIENHRLSNKRMVRSFVLHTMFNVLLFTPHVIWLVFVTYNDLPFARRLWAKISSYFIYCFVIEYSIVLGVLLNGVERVNENLLKLKELPNDLSRKPFLGNHLAVVSLSSHSRLATIKLLRTIRMKLYRASEDVAKFHSFPILVSIGFVFLLFIDRISYLAFYLRTCTNASQSEHPISFLSMVLLIVGAIYSMTLLALNATKISKEAGRTGCIVHKLLATATRQEVKVELEQFSIQALHERFSFTACGLFPLNCEMLHSILQAVVTYVIVWYSNYGGK